MWHLQWKIEGMWNDQDTAHTLAEINLSYVWLQFTLRFIGTAHPMWC